MIINHVIPRRLKQFIIEYLIAQNPRFCDARPLRRRSIEGIELVPEYSTAFIISQSFQLPRSKKSENQFLEKKMKSCEKTEKETQTQWLQQLIPDTDITQKDIGKTKL